MITPIETAARAVAADAFVRGDSRRTLQLSDFRGSWVVLAYAVRRADIGELAKLEEAFAADGAVVLATSPDDWYEVEHRYGADPAVRFPILTGVEERRRMTVIIDPVGDVRHIGLRSSARETLEVLEAQFVCAARAA
jgi:alkyl hydroperoxide reductase subunit AhpC